MLIAGFPSPVTDTNCWVLAPAHGEQCVIVDPGIGIGRWLDEVVADSRLHPVAVLLTHGHIDHTFSVLPVCQARDVPAYIHPDDRGQLTDPWSGLGMSAGTPLLGLERLTLAEPDDLRLLCDGDTLLSGDVLFAGSIGRVDLPGGSLADMTASLRHVILPLPDETVVHPGHGPSTTIGRERVTNPYLLDLL